MNFGHPSSSTDPTLGVDLVSLSRMKRFLDAHASVALERLLTPSERNQVRGKNSPSVVAFSKIFAAKEAFFKASCSAWMGVEGFRSIEVTLGQGNTFLAKRQLPEKNFEEMREGRFFKIRGHLGALVD